MYKLRATLCALAFVFLFAAAAGAATQTATAVGSGTRVIRVETGCIAWVEEWEIHIELDLGPTGGVARLSRYITNSPGTSPGCMSGAGSPKFLFDVYPLTIDLTRGEGTYSGSYDQAVGFTSIQLTASGAGWQGLIRMTESKRFRFNNDTFDLTASFTVGDLTEGCKVSPVTEITDPQAQAFEGWAHSGSRTPPPFSLYFPSIELTLDNGTTSLEAGVQGLQRTSGFRPLAYQAHLRELRDKLQAYHALSNGEQDACVELKEQLDTEIYQVHGLAMHDGLPAVNRPSASLHTRVPTGAIDFGVTGWPAERRAELDRAAARFGLTRPCTNDAVHFTLRGAACDEQIRATAYSPVGLLMIDPLGRRVGFDTLTGTEVNEIGGDVSYSGHASEPQEIAIANPLVGKYQLKIHGTGEGPYTVFLDRVTDDGEIIERTSDAGIATVGMTRELVADKPAPLEMWIKGSADIAVVQPSSRGALPVAVLSTTTFDATRPAVKRSLTFGRTGAEHSLRFCSADEDVNGDGLLDAVCHFDTIASGFTSGDSQAVLRATDGTVPREGVALIATVPRK